MPMIGLATLGIGLGFGLVVVGGVLIALQAPWPR